MEDGGWSEELAQTIAAHGAHQRLESLGGALNTRCLGELPALPWERLTCLELPSTLLDEDTLVRLLGAPGLRGVETLQVTPRVSSTTRESRVRSAWAVAKRIDELLLSPSARRSFRTTRPSELPGLESEPGPA